ncbi:ABC transporter ATP-binding protein [Bacillus massiliigorillae]|uniref:ABC transporter ATP-binding protein n=1 Tax=Bacillus massiliigorillae TaxID=1243664 RepID=UPI00039C5CE7|nr:ABC transporter ATP-binding protein [Bacillus massiliigorillae]
MSFLTIENIHHVYFSTAHANTALENVSMSIEEGEFVSFLGPSGCGKTTLLSIIAGLLKPTSGVTKLDGDSDYTDKKQDIGYMLQQDYLFPWKTIRENILLGLKLQKKQQIELELRALKLLNEIGLTNVESLYPSQLSGGMRQRVALVRTLATNPKLLLLDEPFSALDYVTKLKLENLVFTTLKNFNKTAVLVTHDIGEAIAMSDRIFMFAAKPGRLYQTYTVPEELKNLAPFEARNHHLYSSLFQTIWKEFEGIEEHATKY